MRKLFIYPIVASLAVGVWLHEAGAQSEPPLPAPGITPASPFYILDRLGEAVEKFFTFNPGARARLEISFAAERIAEIKIMLETKGVNAKGLTVAEDRLRAHLATATSIVDKEKAAGRDVSELAKELHRGFKGPKRALRQSFKDQEDALEARGEELEALIREARGTGDTAKAEALLRELTELKVQKNLLEAKEDEQEEALEAEEDRLEDEADAELDEFEDLPDIKDLDEEEWEKLEDLNRALD